MDKVERGGEDQQAQRKDDLLPLSQHNIGDQQAMEEDYDYLDKRKHPTGRAGNPPGLGHHPGSSHQAKVSWSINNYSLSETSSPITVNFNGSLNWC